MSGLPPPPLSQGAGYGVVVGLGAAFAIGVSVALISKIFCELIIPGMILVTKQLKRVFGEDNKTTETYALQPHR